MFLPTLSVVIMCIGTGLGFLYLIFMLIGIKYDAYLKPLNNKEFPMYELYGFGLAVLGVFNYRYSSRKERDRRKEIQLLYDEKFTDYYLSILAAQRITLAYSLLIFGFIFYGITSNISAFFIILLFSFGAYFYYDGQTTRSIKKRSAQLLGDFPEVVSKLALLINAGMIMKEAWNKVAQGGDGLLYEEMRITMTDIENGKAEVDAYNDFGKRCVIPEIKKFTSTVLQGLIKGNQEFSLMIKDQSKEIWSRKQELVQQQGQKAASKLLIPICIIFIGILIMIIVPIFTNLGV